MSRGNYYYAMGWIGNKTSSWADGGIGRFNALEEGFIQSVELFALGAVIQALSTFIGINLFLDVLPLFSFMLGITGAIAILNVIEKGQLYIFGWTFISVLLFVYNIIKVGEFLIDLVPIVVLIVYAIVRSGLLDNVLTIRYRDWD